MRSSEITVLNKLNFFPSFHWQIKLCYFILCNFLALKRQKEHFKWPTFKLFLNSPELLQDRTDFLETKVSEWKIKPQSTQLMQESSLIPSALSDQEDSKSVPACLFNRKDKAGISIEMHLVSALGHLLCITPPSSQVCGILIWNTSQVNSTKAS